MHTPPFFYYFDLHSSKMGDFLAFVHLQSFRLLSHSPMSHWQIPSPIQHSIASYHSQHSVSYKSIQLLHTYNTFFFTIIIFTSITAFSLLNSFFFSTNLFLNHFPILYFFTPSPLHCLSASTILHHTTSFCTIHTTSTFHNIKKT